MLTLLPLVLPLLLTDPAQPKAPDTTALLRAIPAEAVAVVSVADFDALRADAAGNAWMALLKDQAFEPLWAKIEESRAQLQQEGAPFDPKQILDSIHGPLAAFVCVLPDQAGVCGGLLIEAGKDSVAFDGAFQSLGALASASMESSREMHGDATLLVLSEPEAEGEAKDPMEPDRLVLFQAGGLSAAIFGRGEPTLALAREVIDRHASAQKGEGFGGGLLVAARGSGGARRIEAVVDLQRAIALGLQLDPPPEQERKVLEALGIMDFRWAYMGAQLGKGENFDVDFALGMPRKGVMRQLLELMRPAPQRLARMMPKESMGATLYSFDLWGLWKAGWAAAESIAPEEAAAGRGQLDMMSDQMGVDIEADFLSQLTGEFGVVSVPVPGAEWLRGEIFAESDDTPIAEQMPGSAYMIGLADTAIVQQFVEDLLGMAGQAEMLDTELIGERKVYSIELDEELSLQWTYGDRVALLSMHPTAMATLVPRLATPEAPSILEHPAFGPLLTANASAAMVSVGSSGTTLRIMLTAMHAMVEESGHVAGLEFLPPPTIVDKYFRGTILQTMFVQGDDFRASIRGR